MATVVIVHGGWGGAWEWTDVATGLRGRGHEVVTPTLAGMGERAGEPGEVRLAAHVDDVLRALDGREGVVLCAHSYGGIPVSAAADRLPGAVALLVYVDALVPRDGQSALDLLPPWFGHLVRAGLAAHGPAWRVPVPEEALPPAAGIGAEIRAGYVSRLRAQPARTFADAVRLGGALDRIPRAFVRCGATGAARLRDDPIAPFAARARAEGWPFRDLAAPHDPQLFDPHGTARALHAMATSLLPARPAAPDGAGGAPASTSGH